MGYTHCWRYQPSSSSYASAWPVIVHDTAAIVTAVSARVTIAGPDPAGTPVLSAADGIAVNGGPGQHAEPFILAAPGPAARRWWFCKTEAQPYDLAVTATLLRCHLLLPDTFLIASDGDWDEHWRPAQDLVNRLFGATATATPFSDAALPTDTDYQALITRALD